MSVWAGISDPQCRGVRGTVDSESALRSARILLSQVRALPPAPWPDGGPESLRSPCCGLATFKRLSPQYQFKPYCGESTTKLKRKPKFNGSIRLSLLLKEEYFY
ncbi:hypothetical protein PoB_001757300 [Plakobranchus ocellatus]|uniref:Uncharacterized protein n=1 Tax=Plakobranchus ocellatus TaxID=259542 RepID=A0AAV3Z8J5_9GAST|nr:hypothetical protein PoB_001757300 [Plakobranchus ocellatus]